MNAEPLSLYAVCPPGLEALLAGELADLGIFSFQSPSENNQPQIIAGSGGVEFPGSEIDLYRANLHLRCASRILLRLGRFHASKFVELARKTGNLTWENYLQKDRPITLRVTCRRSRLYHSGAVAERVVAGIAERLGSTPLVAEADEDRENAQLIIARLVEDECAISLDTSGAPLHQRGYRQALAKAPLRETLAAGILLASGWDLHSPLIDPFCGSGVIPIEAALLAMRIPPGRNRHFAFVDWPGFDPTGWSHLLAEADSLTREPAGVILASDRDAGAVRMSCENAERAGVAKWIRFSQQAVSAIAPPQQPGWIVTNPPYGVRISHGRDLRNLYAQLGNTLRTLCPGWQVAFLCSDDRLATQTRLSFHEGLSLVNGGIPVKLYRATVP